VLSDLLREMSALSRALNPECEHVIGDMRTLRLGRRFDAVLIHDAIMYLATREDVRAALETAFVHTRAGGALIVAPDCLRDACEESTEKEQSLLCVRACVRPGGAPADLAR
jgi:hypothetical protein